MSMLRRLPIVSLKQSRLSQFKIHRILKHTEALKKPVAPQPKPAAPLQKPQEPKTGGSPWFSIAVVTALAGAGYYYYDTQKSPDYQSVYNDIAQLLENVDYDDGSFGPVLVRLAWHASGTYDKESKTGGSNGATMRFKPESSHGANAGLSVARELLEQVKSKHPKISYSDLWTLAGVVAIQEMGGPVVKWRPGRADAINETFCTPDGRLPDGSKDQSHIRNIFYRMGFNDQEIVALSGAHALGRCHTDRSGFDGPWTFSPTTFTNDYFKLLLSEYWYQRKWNGPKQYYDYKTASLMMLPTDLSLIQDKKFKKYVEQYAKDQDLFFKDFSAAFEKLLELGVPFNPETPSMEFKPVE